jgi:putative hemolysin
MIVQRSDGSWLVDGLLPYSDAEQRIGLPARSTLEKLPSFDTVAGLVLALMEHIPAAGEATSLEDWRIEVVDMDGVRIDKLLISRPVPSGASQTEAALALTAGRPLTDNRE